MKHKRVFNQQPLHIREAMSYGRSDMDQLLDEILVTESINTHYFFTPEV